MHEEPEIIIPEEIEDETVSEDGTYYFEFTFYQSPVDPVDEVSIVTSLVAKEETPEHIEIIDVSAQAPGTTITYNVTIEGLNPYADYNMSIQFDGVEEYSYTITGNDYPDDSPLGDADGDGILNESDTD